MESWKMDCINHVHKRMYTNFKSVRDRNKEVKGGQNGLTNPFITKLGDYYRNKICKYVTNTKDDDEITNIVQQMQLEIMAGLYHNALHDVDAQHQYCPDDN